MTKDIYIRKWQESDWATFKAIRLEGLASHSDVFGASLKAESEKDDSFWKGRLSNIHNGATFGLYDGDTVIGLTAIYRDWNGLEGVAVLCMSYIRPEYRKQKLSDKLYEARIEWVKAEGDIHTLTVGHREGNDASRGANQRWGFVFVGIEEGHEYGNGTTARNYVYELKIK